MVRGTRRNLSNEEVALRNVIARKQLIHTKFFDVETLHILGLEDCTRQLLHHGGLGGFITRNAPTYKDITLDFLCSLKIFDGDDDDDDDDGGFITFYLRGKEFRLDFRSLGAIFGITAECTPNWNDPISDHFFFWERATGHTLEPAKTEYNYKILHPPLRLTHKVLAMAFLGHGEVNKISATDLSTLWCLTPNANIIPDWVDLFLASCLKHKTKPGKISIGGMISLIAKACLKSSEFPIPLPGSHIYDLEALRRAHVLKGNHR